ncbi:MAG: dephospho-CoA kinase [Odoribacter sp.]|nr:dephospho-CoA kinase [Odoribacter sp.]
MKRIGLTGGIGSGKTTVAHILKVLGYPVYLADPEAKRLTNTHPEIRRELIRHFGKDIYDTDGKLNKPRMATLIFNDPKALKIANGIIHPQVMEDFKKWSLQQGTDIVFFESAILFENRLESAFDAVIGVTAPQEIRLQRVLKRDHTSPEKVKERMNSQENDEVIARRSDFLLHNDDKHPLLRQIMEILEKIKKA